MRQQWKLFNKNKSCIEIKGIKLQELIVQEFNKNKSCIEIGLHEWSKAGYYGLIKTRVVLKYQNGWICCLFKEI